MSDPDGGMRWVFYAPAAADLDAEAWEVLAELVKVYWEEVCVGRDFPIERARRLLEEPAAQEHQMSLYTKREQIENSLRTISHYAEKMQETAGLLLSHIGKLTVLLEPTPRKRKPRSHK